MVGSTRRPGPHGQHRAPGADDAPRAPHAAGPTPGPSAAAMTGATAGRHASRDAAAQLLDPVMYRPVRVQPARGGTHLSTVVQLVVAVLLGVLTVTAVGSLRVPQPSDVSARGLLVTQIQERAASADALAADNQSLDGEISALQTELLRTSDRALVTRLEQSSLLAGTVPVAGPGVVVELDDPAGADGDLSPEARVQDVDIQIVVNHLRAAGAEAVAVNGHRLTALSAIRGAGEAIWVDLTPLIPPYRVEAIGDPRAMQAQFARSPGAAHLSLLASTYGIQTSTRTTDALRLAGAGSATLRYATATAEPGDVTSSVPDPGGTS